MNFKRSKVVILPTNNEAVIQPGELFKSIRGFMGLWLKDIKENTYHPECIKQYLYILSDDEIQVGDWCLMFDSLGNSFLNGDGAQQYDPTKGHVLNKGLKKVIASTDPKLNVSIWDDFNTTIAKGMESGKLPEPDIKGLPRPSKAFIQKYVELQGIDEIMVDYDNDKLKISKNNTITIRAVKDKGVLPITGVDEFGFGIPLVHRGNLQTWSSSLFVKVNGYTVSFAGDDGNRGKLGDVSVRHYLNISDPFDISITKSLGFKDYDVTFNDFLKAIEKVKNL